MKFDLENKNVGKNKNYSHIKFFLHVQGCWWVICGILKM